MGDLEQQMLQIPESLRLVEPDICWKEALIDFVLEYSVQDDRYVNDLPKILSDFSTYVGRLKQATQAIHLPAGFVPSSTYWLVNSAQRIVGSINFRYWLSPHLERESGHIGYHIRPTERRKGYGTSILHLLLKKIPADQYARVLVTCNAENVGSAKIIEKNGGVLENHVISTQTGKVVSRYWIYLS